MSVEYLVELYNVWNFAKRDERLGIKANGNIAGQIVMNVLYYYTKQEDLVVDPMAGGGSTIDACVVMNRRCFAFDREPKRDDIRKHDLIIEVDGVKKWNDLPDVCKKTDLIFLDPPYYNMVDGIQNFNDIDEFFEFIRNLAKNCYDVMKKGAVLAFLMQDMTEKGRYCLSGECYKIFGEQGFQYLDHISVPLSTENFLPQQMEKAKKEKHLLGRNRDLYVFRKEK